MDINDSLSYSGSSEIDQYTSDIGYHHDIINKLSLTHSNKLDIRNHENIIEEVNRESIDIRSKQVILNKHFASIPVTETDEM